MINVAQTKTTVVSNTPFKYKNVKFKLVHSFYMF